MAHRVAPQVGQGTPVKRRNKHPGHGSPRLSHAKQLAANPDETVRKRNSKSVSFGASGRNVKPTLRLTRDSHDPVGKAYGVSIRRPPDRDSPKAFAVRRCIIFPKLLATGDLLICAVAYASRVYLFLQFGMGDGIHAGRVCYSAPGVKAAKCSRAHERQSRSRSRWRMHQTKWCSKELPEAKRRRSRARVQSYAPLTSR